MARHVAVTADEDAPAVEPPWRGMFAPYGVGDPGRAPSRVIVVPDRSDWHRRDTVLDGFTVLGVDRKPVVHVRAASVRGLAHRCYGRVRQDEYAYRITDDGRFLVLCVADGVSAGTFSHWAAIWAARAGTRLLSQMLARSAPDAVPWDRFMAEVVAVIERDGRLLLRDNGVADAEVLTRHGLAAHLATTVLYAVVDLCTENAEHLVHLVNVGDTSAWVLDVDGDWCPLQPIKNDGAEIYSSAVMALPAYAPAEPVPVGAAVRAGEAFVLMSDGVGDPLGAGTGAVGRFLADAWRTPPADLDFAAQVGFTRRSFDDDRTVIAVWPADRS